MDAAGSALPIGTPVRTFIDGVEYSNASFVDSSAGGFSVLTYGNWMTNQSTPETPTIKEGADLNELVLYAAGSFTTSVDTFQEVLLWWPGRITTTDLHFGSAATTPEPIKIQGIVPQPARGGNQFLLLCNPTPNPVPLASYYLEVDRPGSYRGPNITLAGTIPSNGEVRVNLTSASYLSPTGDALKLVYRNPGGANASAGRRDIVVDRLEYNATRGGTLYWEPGNTILGDAPAPGIGQILQRSPACADTNSPEDFQRDVEPDLPENQPPTVSVTSPTAGQTVTAGERLNVTWTMADDIFPNLVLQVWVNVTYSGTTTNLVNGSGGATSYSWLTPDTDIRGAVITVDVLDPFGARGTATSGAFDILIPQPYGGLGLLVAVLVIVVIAAFLLYAFLRATRGKESPPAAAPPSAPQPPAAATPPVQEVAALPTSAAKKVCPRCGTTVNAEDPACFFCGYSFPKPPA